MNSILLIINCLGIFFLSKLSSLTKTDLMCELDLLYIGKNKNALLIAQKRTSP
jgi:hypothetical protein